MSIVTSAQVLEFWFDADDGSGTGRSRVQWFRKDPAFDAQIESRFGATVAAALQGDLAHWSRGGLRDRLALILVLDQFTRNIFRGTGRMFDGDARALAIAHRLWRDRDDRRLTPLERWFAYLPFEHSERLADQDLALSLFEELREFEQTASAYDWAVRHREVILRFGRFPHRNALLARESTPAELEFLATPGSSF